MADLSNAYDPNAEASTDYGLLPAGEYIAQIDQGDEKPISSQSDKGKCYVFTWRILDGEYEGRLIWQRISLKARNMNNLDKVIQIANEQFASIRQATGVKAPRTTDELLGIPCVIKVKVKEDKTGKYDAQNEVTNVKPVDDAPTPTRTAAPQRTSAPAQAAKPSSAGSGTAAWRKPAKPSYKIGRAHV